MADVIVKYESVDKETDNAYLISFGEILEPIWLPKSQVHVDEDDKDVTMPEWLHKKHFQ